MRLSNYPSLDELFIRVGKNHSVSPVVVKKVYESVFSFIRETLREMPNLRETSIEDMEKLKSNFYIARFARFFIDIEKIRKKRQLNIKKYVRKEN